MKIEVGKTYKRRNGQISKCTTIDSLGIASFHSGEELWANTGLRSRTGTSEFDVVSEFKLETSGPVVTETVVTIRNGRYGAMRALEINNTIVQPDGSKQVNLRIMSANHSADQLREFADILNTIAEAM